MSIFQDVCPRCAGKGKTAVHEHLRSHVNDRIIADLYKQIDCDMCGGSGRISNTGVIGRFAVLTLVLLAIMFFVIVPLVR